MNGFDTQGSEIRLSIVHAWNWLAANSQGIVIALVASAVLVSVLLGIRALGCRLLSGAARPVVARVTGRVLSVTQGWFIAALAVELVADLVTPPPVVDRLIGTAFTIALALQAAIWLRELILAWVEARAQTEAGDHGSLASALGIIKLLVSVAAFVLAAVLILDNLGVNVTALVAGLGIGGIAIGLAAQGIFSDLFAALSILFDKPFRKGDTISWDQSTGTVEAIGLKTTRVRAITGERVVISNANLLNKELRNLEGLERRRISFILALIYQTPPEKLEKLPGLLRGLVEQQKHCVFVRASFHGFNASSLDFELLFDVIGQDYDTVLELRTQIGIAILRAFAEQGLEFAYPTQTTFTAAPDGTMVLPYATERGPKPTGLA